MSVLLRPASSLMALSCYVNKDTDFNYMEIDVYCELLWRVIIIFKKDPKSTYPFYSLWYGCKCIWSPGYSSNSSEIEFVCWSTFIYDFFQVSYFWCICSFAYPQMLMSRLCLACLLLNILLLLLLLPKLVWTHYQKLCFHD